MRGLLNLLDPYIGLMMLMVLLAFLLPASGIGADIVGMAADAAIIFLFFLYGTRLSPRAALDGMTQWRLQGAILLCTFVLFPLLGLLLKAGAAPLLPAPLVTGLLFLCLMPSTVQSSVAFTAIARGNIAAALCAASMSNLLGVVLSPLLAGWLMQARGVTLSFDIFRDIFLQLLAPFLVGQMLRPRIGEWIARHRRLLGLTDRGSILLIIYVAFSHGVRDNIWAQVAVTDMAILLILLSLLLAVVLVLTGYVGRRILRFGAEDEIVLQFCGSKKSLASGLPMATVLFPGPQLGLIVLPLMLFHQIQLIVCAMLARKYGARAQDGPASPP